MAKKVYDDRHGGPWDRGQADSYYRRPYAPHFFAGATYSTPRISREEMTPEEIEAYKAGYDQNERDGIHKEWD